MAGFGSLGGLGGARNAVTPLTGDELLQMARANGGARLNAYNPTIRDRIGYAIYDAAGGLGGLGGTPNTVRENVLGLLDMLPGTGDALAAEELGGLLGSGNWKDAAVSAGLLALGLIPVAGDVAAKGVKNLGRSAAKDVGEAAKELPYHRFTRGDNPDTGVGYMMFAEGDPERVRNYGQHHWGTDPNKMPSGAVIDASDPDVQREFAEMLRDNWDEVEFRGYGHASPEDLASELAPADIVDGAGIWDSDLINLAWEKFFEPKGVVGVKTPDGFVAFDPKYVQKIIDK